jgi:hypothetical protein
MEEFLIYLKMGWHHVLDFNAYDHVLFFIALTIPFTFTNWRKALGLITIFTIGHTFALVLSVYQILVIKAEISEFLIPVTIFLTALYQLFTAGKTQKSSNIGFVLTITTFFGIVHGLGFSNYIKPLLMTGEKLDKLLPLLEFALGIELAQITVVLTLLILGYFCTGFFKVSKRDWALVLSAIVIGVVLPMILNSEIFA